jgi:hypothetical protein
MISLRTSFSSSFIIIDQFFDESNIFSGSSSAFTRLDLELGLVPSNKSSISVCCYSLDWRLKESVHLFCATGLKLKSVDLVTVCRVVLPIDV